MITTICLLWVAFGILLARVADIASNDDSHRSLNVCVLATLAALFSFIIPSVVLIVAYWP
jgi:hypothetical protein